MILLQSTFRGIIRCHQKVLQRRVAVALNRGASMRLEAVSGAASDKSRDILLGVTHRKPSQVWN
ncbi:Protein of unknown function [Gryllus bimaculatus]|nr:Protein of unknown function [Gryllus bimaculatus]